MHDGMLTLIATALLVSLFFIFVWAIRLTLCFVHRLHT